MHVTGPGHGCRMPGVTAVPPLLQPLPPPPGWHAGPSGSTRPPSAGAFDRSACVTWFRRLAGTWERCPLALSSVPKPGGRAARQVGVPMSSSGSGQRSRPPAGAAVVLVEDGGSERSRRCAETREHETALHAGLSAGVTLTLAILGRCGSRSRTPCVQHTSSTTRRRLPPSQRRPNPAAVPPPCLPQLRPAPALCLLPPGGGPRAPHHDGSCAGQHAGRHPAAAGSRRAGQAQL